MPTTWYELPDHIPTDAQTVWVRVRYYHSGTFLATWSLANKEFTSVTNSIVYPAWIIARWRSQT